MPQARGESKVRFIDVYSIYKLMYGHGKVPGIPLPQLFWKVFAKSFSLNEKTRTLFFLFDLQDPFSTWNFF